MGCFVVHNGFQTFDSPAMVTGVTQVTKGTFALGTNMPNHVRSAAELPVFSNLVFTAGICHVPWTSRRPVCPQEPEGF